MAQAAPIGIMHFLPPCTPIILALTAPDGSDKGEPIAGPINLSATRCLVSEIDQ